MIKLKISMNSGVSYRIRNLDANSVYDFIKNTLMPGSVELIWYEVLPTQFIRVSSISSIEVIPGDFEEGLEEKPETDELAEKVEKTEITEEPLEE